MNILHKLLILFLGISVLASAAELTFDTCDELIALLKQKKLSKYQKYDLLKDYSKRVQQLYGEIAKEIRQDKISPANQKKWGALVQHASMAKLRLLAMELDFKMGTKERYELSKLIQLLIHFYQNEEIILSLAGKNGPVYAKLNSASRLIQEIKNAKEMEDKIGLLTDYFNVIEQVGSGTRDLKLVERHKSHIEEYHLKQISTILNKALDKDTPNAEKVKLLEIKKKIDNILFAINKTRTENNLIFLGKILVKKSLIEYKATEMGEKQHKDAKQFLGTVLKRLGSDDYAYLARHFVFIPRHERDEKAYTKLEKILPYFKADLKKAIEVLFSQDKHWYLLSNKSFVLVIDFKNWDKSIFHALYFSWEPDLNEWRWHRSSTIVSSLQRQLRGTPFVLPSHLKGKEKKTAANAPAKEIKDKLYKDLNAELIDKFQKANPGVKNVKDFLMTLNKKSRVISFEGTNIVNLSPLKGRQFTSISLFRTPVSDISPLKGMHLVSLDMRHTKVSDLSPLKGMKLTWLNAKGTKVSTIDALKGMPLVYLNLSNTTVKNADAIKGMPIKKLDLANTGIDTIAFLEGSPIEILSLAHTKVTNIEALKGSKIYALNLKGTDVKTVKHLSQLKLIYLELPKNAVDLDFLRGHRTLTHINGIKFRRFWKDYDARKK